MSHILSLIGCALTGLQTFLILYQGSGICLNEGCEIVDSLTIIPPLYFNVAGFLFFLFISFGISRARKGSELWQRFTSLMLLAAIAAEAVLVCFQYFITDVFCSYCLIIFSLIVLTNIFFGLRQTFRSIVIFSAICMAFASLDFNIDTPSDLSLDEGTLASFEAGSSDRELYLFFSSTCPHCEDVIEMMKDELTCNVNFNPVDQIDSFTFPNIKVSASTDPRVNIRYLKHLGINEVPAMASIQQQNISVLKGQTAIVAYLQQHCLPTEKIDASKSNDAQSSDYSFPLPAEDSCTVAEDCEEQTGSHDTQTSTTLPDQEG